MIDEAWLGPRGLLDRLETELGLGQLPPTRTERAADLVDRCARMEGFWSASHEADPLGTADRLLLDRDTLRLWGWRGERVSRRLAALADVTEDARPGMPDRLEKVCDELAHQRPDIHAIELVFPERLLPTLWRRVIAGLRAAGVTVSEAPPVAAHATGDLGEARRETFTPVGDGSLTLYRPHGSLAAAEEVAGALAARDSLDDVLLVGADSVLADALERAGLPRPPSEASGSESVGALRLVVELMFDPADPALAYKLLCLDPGPIPRTIARKLVHALAKLPGRRSQVFRQALEHGLAGLDDERRERVRARVSGLLEPVVPRDQPVPREAVIQRMRLVATWARGMAEHTPSVIAVAIAAEHFIDVLRALSTDELRWVALRRLLDEIDDIRGTARAADAGLARVAEPGAVLGEAPVVLWWGFTRDRVRPPRSVWLSESERAALADAGVTPPSSAILAAGQALRWRRPLEQATQALVLVCPRVGEANKKGFPHPLWDELVAAAGGAGAAAPLITRELAQPAVARRTRVALRPRPTPQTEWHVGRAVALRERGESPSSLERLLGCSLQWALGYHGRLRARFAPPITPGPLLYGTIAHLVLAQVFEEGALPPDDARAKADAILESELRSFCETLFLPRYQVERATLTHGVLDSAADLARRIEAMGATLRGVEIELDRAIPELALRGIADMVLQGPDSVIDLKWSKTASRDKLVAGSALQLAAYAELARTGSARPQIAYFVLRNQQLLAEPGASFPDAEIPGEHTASDIWRGAMNALTERRAELARGELRSDGSTSEDIKDELDGDALTIAPPCRYCSFAALCGRGGRA